MLQELSRSARVFRGHNIAFAKGAQGPERDVFQVPDRRRHQVKRAGPQWRQ
jgi:hypothetical protein